MNKWGFPYELYDIQNQFIDDAIKVISDGKIGIFSSPTGTGKTISLLSVCTNFAYHDNDNLYNLLFSANKTKIYYCSRTHTQLAQVLHELDTNIHHYNTVILGSRKLYCIHPIQSTCNDIEELNSKCHELIVNNKCEYYKGSFYQSGNASVNELRQKGLCEKFCPYYYSKDRAAMCEIVLLPYNLLFTQEGRNSVDIDIDGKIVIVDEAHNICDTIIELNTVELIFNEIKKIGYCKGISSNLKDIITKILYFQNVTTNISDTIISVDEFIHKARLEHYNMFDIEEFIKNNKLAQRNNNPFIFKFSRFLKLLTFSNSNDIIVYNKTRIKFTPLSPQLYLKELYKCKSVLFAGGTMEPIDQLASIFDPIKYYNYHVSNRHILPIILGTDITNKEICLIYDNRDRLLNPILKTLYSLSYIAKNGGVIVFFPSKTFLELIKQNMDVNSFRKPIYFDDSFELFKQNQGILFTVMGGKLSEGINFEDDACRLLIVVGVPFPSNTIEFKKRIRHDSQYGINQAMNKVNQAIGRAIRHANDYAAVVLMDIRYKRFTSKLSPWINSKLKILNCCQTLEEINRFFKSFNH